MRFQGHVHGVDVQILLGSGNSDNFIQPLIAHGLKLHIQPDSKFQVLVCNGHTLTSEGFISDLPLSIQGHLLVLPMYLLPIAGTDLVLGAPCMVKNPKGSHC